MTTSFRGLLAVTGVLATALAGCGGLDEDPVVVPQLSPATGATLASCTDLATRMAYANTTFAAASAVAAGTLTVGGQPVAAHCRVTGQMFPRTSAVDGQTYAIGFEMRLPTDWNGRFWYQANGGTDGSVSTATGALGGGPLTHALAKGFAVLSSDAGHSSAQNPRFGIDPQARLDFGYQAVAKLTPMAKEAIRIAYGKQPDRSYLGGCSNGGRHAMVAASRSAADYDGIVAGNPGTVLPRAAIANIAGYQTYVSLASNPADASTGFTAAERTLVSNAVLARCDALDGATDGMVQATAACQAAFSLDRDVPTCAAARDGTCLSAAQKTGIDSLFRGARTSAGTTIYSSFPYDTGLYTGGWAFWKFTVPPLLDAGAIAHIWQVPPVDPATFVGSTFALTSSVDDLLAKVQATNATYTEAATSFMSPPNPTDLSALRNRGAKLLIYHGTADPIFSSDESAARYDAIRAAQGGDASDFARLFLIPGMNHCSGGPAADQFDIIQPLVDWVERGIAPASLTASARGAGNPGGVNADVPSTWSAGRTRPLCPYPQVARYRGTGSLEQAASFECRP